VTAGRSKTRRVVITFKSKAEATSGGEFEKAIGATGCAFTKKTAP
jgi:hypothetical protein